MKKINVKVIVPIYRSELSVYEEASLTQTAQILKGHRIVLLHPQELDVSELMLRYPTFETLAVSDEWLGTRNGINGYNRMMLSREFYDLFTDTEYILICHTDAWIFRDELAEWCRRGYDCIAAPWLRRKVYDLPLVRQYMALRRWIAACTGVLSRQLLYGRIGNGGLSLRRVESFRKACRRHQPRIDHFLSQKHHLFNEDVFWAIEPDGFRYPTWQEALGFAFDANPAACYRTTHARLPFGCHGWSKPHMLRFWRAFIKI